MQEFSVDWKTEVPNVLVDHQPHWFARRATAISATAVAHIVIINVN